MSQQAIYDVDFKDEKLLVEVLKEMGYNAIVHKKAVALDTYAGRNQVKAHIVIKKQQHGFTYGDMGFERTKNGGLKFHADHIDVKKFNLSQLKQKYSKAFVAKRIRLLGTKYLMGEEEIDQNGTMKITIKVMD